MSTYLVKRHLIADEEGLSVFSEQVEKMKKAIEISRSKNYDINFGIKLTVDEPSAGADFLSRIYNEISKVPKEIRFMYEEKDRGAATSYKKISFNPGFWNNPDIIVDACLDQYILDSEIALERANELIQKVRKNGALYATGSRDVPLIYGRYESSSNIRLINELFHSLTIGSDKLRVDEKMENVTPAFAEIGESTSGFYVLNISHPFYPELAKNASGMTSKEFGRFGIDYYVAIKSSQIAGIEKGYVSSYANRFYGSKTEEKELEEVKNTIKTTTKGLSTTDIADALFKALSNDSNTEKIAEFYPKEQVNLVREIMLESFKG